MWRTLGALAPCCLAFTHTGDAALLIETEAKQRRRKCLRKATLSCCRGCTEDRQPPIERMLAKLGESTGSETTHNELREAI